MLMSATLFEWWTKIICIPSNFVNKPPQRSHSGGKATDHILAYSPTVSGRQIPHAQNKIPSEIFNVAHMQVRDPMFFLFPGKPWHGARDRSSISVWGSTSAGKYCRK
ncbi:hypothetical protein BC936DRAFT_148449 [Jimgerdemannia flammicorona]|uniref:Uncharacterized protein n=1 Tax=Jimgerdemannia flammicorona TaxID=994334 RepID=A0A433D308_9FUNG|nr:hypothetical protein BC936DRAFT_148449 [Jimgerdemannia flammicorona]